MKLRLLTLFTLAGIAFSANAQDPQFSQFYANPIYTNPAFAGSECGRIVMNYRNQWPSLPGTFVTYNASYDQRIKKIGGGLGFMATVDQAGEGRLTATHLSAIYAYELEATRELTFRFGIQASYVEKKIDFSKLRFGDQIKAREGFVLNTNEPFISAPVRFPNFGAGLLAYTQKFYAGFAAHNITQPNQSFYGSNLAGTSLPMRYTLHSGLVIPLDGNKRNPESTISPNILIMSQAKFNQVNVGFYLNKGPLVAGLWFRQTQPTSDALLVLLGFRQNNFKFGYSYDITVSSARSAAPGSHEVSAGYLFCASRQVVRYKKLSCPDF